MFLKIIFYFSMFSDQDDFSNFFAGDENRNSWKDDRLGDRRPVNRWSTEREEEKDKLLYKNRYHRDKIAQGDRRPDDRYHHM